MCKISVIVVVDHPDVLFRASQPTRGEGIIQGIQGQDAVQIEDYLRRQGIASAFRNRAHGMEIVEDHPLALVPGPSPLA